MKFNVERKEQQGDVVAYWDSSDDSLVFKIDRGCVILHPCGTMEFHGDDSWRPNRNHGDELYFKGSGDKLTITF